MVKEFICKCEVDEKDPPEPNEVCDFIEMTFDITYSQLWINQLVENSDDFFLADATPLEDACINVKEEDLQKNHQQLTQKLANVDPQFICNIDECGWGKKLKLGKKRVISLSPANTNYHEHACKGHITMIPISWANSDFSQTMLIVQTKTIEQTLLPFGIPDSPNVLVVRSTC